MPTIDLRDSLDHSQFNPLANFLVLAAMLCPADKNERERVLDTIRQENMIKKRRRGALDDPNKPSILAYGTHRGAAAGFLYATLLQLRFAHGVDKPTLHMAIEVYRELVRSDHPIETHGPFVNYQTEVAFFPRSPNTMYRVFEEFGPVAHLWAAFLNLQQLKAHPPSPRHEQHHPPQFPAFKELIRLLGYANAIREKYEKMTENPGLRRRLWIPQPFKFKTPDAAITYPRVEICPIPDGCLQHITRQSDIK
jgi:hypothetical protein